MGVRGLTSYIAQRAEQYLIPYELHDCYLVIDGDNIACNIYKDVTGTYSAFGGDYDDFYRAVVNFFHTLGECNIKPIVLLDGGYERRKLRTVEQRLRGKIAVIKRINPCGSVPVFPLLMKEVFIDAVRDCGVPVMRCVFEADEELAALGRKLNCPVLSYDSDFYIHNVQYIPLVTLTMKAHTKRVPKDKCEEDDQNVTRKLRKNEAKHIEKQTKANRIMNEITVNNKEKLGKKDVKTYKYLDCCIYRIEHLISRRSLTKEKLPLFAALLGNDYITRSCFRNFFEINLTRGGPKRKMKVQQKRIQQILLWLKNETTETALNKVLGRLKKDQRDSLMQQVEAATLGYSNERCDSYDFLNENYENIFNEAIEYDSDNGNGDFSDCSSDSLYDSFEIEDSPADEEEEILDEESAEEEEEDEENCNNDIYEDKYSDFPDWFLEKLYTADLPRFMVDLMHLKKYINSPQIEHFEFEDCNQIALPILIQTFTLLNAVDKNVEEKSQNAEQESQPKKFTYLTRVTRVTNVHYVDYVANPTDTLIFVPNERSPMHLHNLIAKEIPQLNKEQFFAKVEELPVDLQLYFIAIIYWLRKSNHCDFIHLHALVICLIILRTVDSKVPVERDLRAFEKRFGKIITKERQIRASKGGESKMKEELLALPIRERMKFIKKSDCLLVQEKLLKHFHMQEIFKKKYDLYSSQILHAFAEFQCVVFQLHALNSLLNLPYENPHMGQLFCGVFNYNLYDLLRERTDVRYYVKNFIFADSPMMFEFYCYLIDWCQEFIPQSINENMETVINSVSKKTLKKRRQQERRNNAKTIVKGDPYKSCCSDEGDGALFQDLNNKFCALTLGKSNTPQTEVN